MTVAMALLQQGYRLVTSYGLVTAEVPFGDNHGLATPVPVMNILYVRASYWDVI